MIQTKTHQLTIRGVSKSSLHTLKRIAKKNNRSVSAQVVSMINMLSDAQKMKDQLEEKAAGEK